MSNFTPKTEYISAYLKQIKNNPEAFFSVDKSYLKLEEFSKTASKLAIEVKSAITIEKVNKIMRASKKKAGFNVLEDLQKQAKNFADFKNRVKEALGEKVEKAFYTPAEFIVDAVVKIIEREPSLFEQVEIDFFTSKSFIEKASAVAIASQNKQVKKDVKKIEHDAKKEDQIMNVEKLNKLNKQINEFEDSVFEIVDKNVAEIYHTELTK